MPPYSADLHEDIELTEICDSNGDCQDQSNGTVKKHVSFSDKDQHKIIIESNNNASGSEHVEVSVDIHAAGNRDGSDVDTEHSYQLERNLCDDQIELTNEMVSDSSSEHHESLSQSFNRTFEVVDSRADRTLNIVDSRADIHDSDTSSMETSTVI